MLVLTRRKFETLCIGDNIKVTVVAIRGDKVRLGVEAPKDIRVQRNELGPWDESKAAGGGKGAA